ncbi:MAG: cell division protein ZapA [Bacteroidota bacterium]
MGEISIKVKIADRPYKLLVDAEDELGIVKASELIGAKIDLYADKYAYKDFQDLLAMVLLEIAVEKVRNENQHVELEKQLAEKLSSLSEIFTK